MLESFKDLKVWQKAYKLCLAVYRLTKSFPAEEKYTLVMQLRKCAISIASNIAEGYGRKSRAEYVQFLYVACGSTGELETQILLSGDLGFLRGKDKEELLFQTKEVAKMLRALIISLRT